MSKKFDKRKYTPDVLAVGLAAFLGSSAIQEVLLMPKMEIKITDDIKIPVQGLLPLSQKYVALITQKALNEVIPAVFVTTTKVLDKLSARDRTRDALIWFLYDFLGKYSLNSLFSTVSRKTGMVDEDRYKDVLRELIEKYINEKVDRDIFIKHATKEVVRILRIITEGTLASMLFNERFAEAASGTIAAAIDRFLDNEAAARLSEYLLTFVNQIDDVTVPAILEKVFGLDRLEMANLFDKTYDSAIGVKAADFVNNIRLGDITYDLIASVDYNMVYNYTKNNMGNDLFKLSLGGAMTAMSLYSGSKKIARRIYKSKDRVDRLMEKLKHEDET